MACLRVAPLGEGAEEHHRGRPTAVEQNVRALAPKEAVVGSIGGGHDRGVGVAAVQRAAPPVR